LKKDYTVWSQLVIVSLTHLMLSAQFPSVPSHGAQVLGIDLRTQFSLTATQKFR